MQNNNDIAAIVLVQDTNTCFKYIKTAAACRCGFLLSVIQLYGKMELLLEALDMCADVAHCMGAVVAVNKFPLAVNFCKLVEFTVHPDNLGIELSADALGNDQIGASFCGLAVFADGDLGVDAQVHGLGGAVFVLHNAAHGLQIAFGALGEAGLAVKVCIHVLEQLTDTFEVAAVNQPAVLVQKILDFNDILSIHKKTSFQLG